MVIKYNSNHIFVNYIKQLLSSFNLPQIKVIDNNTPVRFEGVYINKDTEQVESYKTIVDKSGKAILDKSSLHHYSFNDPLLNMTKNFIIKDNIYDNYTHKYLGNFLRFIRDYTGINLMQLYNCFSNEIPLNLDIRFELNNKQLINISSKDTNYRYYILPVKLCKEYTIAIENTSAIEMFCCYYDGNNLIDGVSHSGEEINTNSNKKLASLTYKKINNSFFNKPFLYDNLLNIDKSEFYEEMLQYEKYLNLVIKLPYDCKSSIVVQEGNYLANNDYEYDNYNKKKKLNTPQYFRINSIDKDGNYIMSTNTLPKDYLTLNQLTNMNNYISYPFADRLLEYLIFNVITPIDEIDKNIYRTQLGLLSRYNNGKVGTKLFTGHAGIWDDKLREVIYRIAVEESTAEGRVIDNNFDILGYVDKDIEPLITKYINEEEV